MGCYRQSLGRTGLEVFRCVSNVVLAAQFSSLGFLFHSSDIDGEDGGSTEVRTLRLMSLLYPLWDNQQ